MKKLLFVMMLLSVFSYTSGNIIADEKSAQNENRPNILLIHTDDVGWGDYSIYNSESKIKTPEIDHLAQTGIRFTNAHTPAALCAPTRYAILTGNYPWRGRYAGGDWNWHTDTQFLSGQKTFGHFLQQAGYRTAMFGKANLGLVYEKMIDDKTPDFSSKLAEGPVQWGFDYSYIIPRGHQSFPYAFYENNILVGDPKNVVQLKAGTLKGDSVVTADGPGYSDWNSADVGRTLTEKATAFIDDVLAKNKAEGKHHPFLIHFNTDGAHTPHTPSDVLFGKKLKGETITPQTDMILETEIITGQLVKVLKERNLYANTIIIVTSDNGGIPAGKLEKFGHDAVGGLRGNKSTIWEGGTRVPFIIHWGDDTINGSKIKPGTVTNQVVGTHDLATTFAEIAGVEPGEDQALDSVSFLPVLLGKQSEDKPIRESLLVQSSPGRDTTEGRIPPELRERFQNRPRPLQAYQNYRAKLAQDEGFDGIGHAVLKDGWKLILGLTDKPEFLANLKDDPKETINLLEDSANKKRIEEYQNIYKSIRESKRSTPPLKL
ncbi:MAG: sulfatase-like hydrolase/transferase [Planctomycetaceae bacterium]|jgi:arylsulfatase A-like enzyme|nr:sulfatase-like hydrolase/transferase [Planctomycetaceae bacterium]